MNSPEPFGFVNSWIFDLYIYLIGLVEKSYNLTPLPRPIKGDVKAIFHRRVEEGEKKKKEIEELMKYEL